MIPLETVERVQMWHRAKKPLRAIARDAGIDRKTVRRIVASQTPADLTKIDRCKHCGHKQIRTMGQACFPCYLREAS